MNTYIAIKKNPKKKPEFLSLNERLWADNPAVSAKASLTWDEENLYVHLEAKEPDIRAKEKGPLGSPCEDSCLEFFFCPMAGDSRYFNIEVNPNGCMYLGFASSIENLVRLLPETNTPISPVIKMNKTGWSVSYTIPATFIQRFFPRFRLYDGKTIRANFYKCGDKTKKEHYLAWNKIGGTKVSYHQPKWFGKIILKG